MIGDPLTNAVTQLQEQLQALQQQFAHQVAAHLVKVFLLYAALLVGTILAARFLLVIKRRLLP